MRRGNGDGSIFKLSGKRRKPWAVRVTVGWTPEGKQKYKYLGYYETKQAAKKALREYLLNPYDLATKDTTIAEIYQLWEKNAELSDGTLRSYRSAFRQSFILHNRKIRDVKIQELENVMYQMNPNIQRNFKAIMQHVYRQAIKYDITGKNLAEFLKPKKAEHKQRIPFTEEQVLKILDFKHKQNDIVLVLLYTGMRINELLKLPRENVNLTDRYMIGGSKSEAGKKRVIPIHDEIFGIIEKWYAGSKDYLVEYDGKKLDYNNFLGGYWRRLQEHLDTDQTPHCTRHTFITQADKAGVSRIALKKIVGHSSKDVTDDIYTHKGIQELLHEVNKVKYR